MRACFTVAPTTGSDTDYWLAVGVDFEQARLATAAQIACQGSIGAGESGYGNANWYWYG